MDVKRKVPEAREHEDAAFILLPRKRLLQDKVTALPLLGCPLFQNVLQ